MMRGTTGAIVGSDSGRVDARRRAFTLLELLVVIGIIGVLLAILLPAVASARRSAKCVRCQSNQHTIGQALHAYAGENRGWPYPMPIESFNLDTPPHARWPAVVFKVPAALGPLPYDPASFTRMPYDPDTFPVKPYTPEVLMCPTEDRDESLEAHTYILNGHLGERRFRLGHRDLAGRSPSEVVLAGEKYPDQRDYFLERNEFNRLVDAFRHGAAKGSNYLFVDGHVELQLPRDVMGGLDPWDLLAPNGK
jgi:prepilin-type N-terminal cleavage/methylation domain-containing protein/prepilin-type processing-associated H-X9-DG protein